MKKLLLSLLMILGVGLSANAQMIGATNRQQTTSTSNYSHSTHPLGFLGRIELGNPVSFGICYQTSPNLMFGAGLSLLTYNQNSEYPPRTLYVEGRYSTPNYNFAYFFDARVCVNLNDHGDGTPFGFSAMVGIMYKALSFGVGVGFIDDGLAKYYSWSYNTISATDLIYPAISACIDIPLKKRL